MKNSFYGDGITVDYTDVVYELDEEVKLSNVAIVPNVVSSAFVTALKEIHEYVKVIPTHSREAVE